MSESQNRYLQGIGICSWKVSMALEFQLTIAGKFEQIKLHHWPTEMSLKEPETILESTRKLPLKYFVKPRNILVGTPPVCLTCCLLECLRLIHWYCVKIAQNDSIFAAKMNYCSLPFHFKRNEKNSHSWNSKSLNVFCRLFSIFISTLWTLELNPLKHYNSSNLLNC